jgi:hypothetical protein
MGDGGPEEDLDDQEEVVPCSFQVFCSRLCSLSLLPHLPQSHTSLVSTCPIQSTLTHHHPLSLPPLLHHPSSCVTLHPQCPPSAPSSVPPSSPPPHSPRRLATYPLSQLPNNDFPPPLLSSPLSPTQQVRSRTSQAHRLFVPLCVSYDFNRQIWRRRQRTGSSSCGLHSSIRQRGTQDRLSVRSQEPRGVQTGSGVDRREYLQPSSQSLSSPSSEYSS